MSSAEEYYRKWASFEPDTELGLPACPMLHRDLFELMQAYADAGNVGTKAQALISFYKNEGGHKIHRVYLEQHFVQAKKDLQMILDAEGLSKDWELQECEIYNPTDFYFKK